MLYIAKFIWHVFLNSALFVIVTIAAPGIHRFLELADRSKLNLLVVYGLRSLELVLFILDLVFVFTLIAQSTFKSLKELWKK